MSTSFVIARRPAGLTRLLSFCLVGGIGAVVNTAALALLHTALHWPVVLASAAATELAVVNNYLLNERITFATESLSRARFLRFNLVSLGGLAATVSVVTLLNAGTGMPVVVANLFGIAAALAWNFIANTRWTWNGHRDSQRIEGLSMPRRPRTERSVRSGWLQAPGEPLS